MARKLELTESDFEAPVLVMEMLTRFVRFGDGQTGWKKPEPVEEMNERPDVSLKKALMDEEQRVILLQKI